MDAWAWTLTQHEPVEVQRETTGEPHRTSGPGQCEKSPDTRHWWDLAAVGQQSLEVFQCRHCGERIYD